jgi:tetratricopeptide (TPR) repeat protein
VQPASSSYAHIDNVPFYPNTSDQCGPAVLASLLNYWGKNVTPEELKKEVYVPRLNGTLPIDLLPALHSRGIAAETLYGSFDRVKTEIRGGRPVLAYLNFGTKKHPIGHFVVINGFDDEKKVFIIHSLKPDKLASYKRFDRGWNDTHHWMIVAEPSAQPLTVSTSPVQTMAVEQEPLTADDHVRLGQIYDQQGLTQEAADQYRRALNVDKGYVPAHMALGNQAFNRKNYAAAERYFKRALKYQPDHPGANNNLAMTYVMQGKNLSQAEKLAKIAAASPDYSVYANDTLAQIEQARHAR